MKANKYYSNVSILIIIILFIGASKLPKIKQHFIRFDNDLYSCKHEVTINEYNEFLLDMKSKNQEDYLACIADTSQWRIKFPSLLATTYEQYHIHPGYGNYPIVNITLQSAKKYCEWMTDKYKNNPEKQFPKVKFRLPSEKEWKKLANPLPSHNLPWYGNFPFTDDGKTFRANVKVINVATGYTDYLVDKGLLTLTAGHYLPNNIGILDVIGNVSEMTEDGTLKGGSWDNFIEECTIEKAQTYTLPDPRVGFRVVMEVIH